MPSPRKPCKKCKKQIPAIALDCVFCGAKQEAPPLEELLPAALTRAKEVAAKVEAQAASGNEGGTDDFADSFSTEPTLVGLKVADLAALGIGAPQPSKADPAATPPPAKSVYGDPVEPYPTKPDAKSDAKPEATTPSTPAKPAPKAEPKQPQAAKAAPPSTKITQAVPVFSGAMPSAAEEPAADPGAAARALRVAQSVAIGAGFVMMVLFFLPWGGASSWQLIETLGGVAFMRQFWYLAGGLTLVAAGALPLPIGFRRVALVAFALPSVVAGPGGSALSAIGWLAAAGVIAAAARLWTSGARSKDG